MSGVEEYIDQVEGEDQMSRELVTRRPQQQAVATLFRTDEPGEVIVRATKVADSLSAVLRAKGLTTKIGNREHVQVEGWTLCGSMLGVFPVVVWSRRLDNGWEARAHAVTQAGAVVGAAEAQCTREEKEWGPNPTRGKPRDDYALRSMAQTRAISKALRLPLGFIVTLAGFAATPADEIPEAEAEPDRPFDPGRDVLPGAISGERFLERLGECFKVIDANVAWREVLDEQLDRKQWETDGKSEEFWRRTANAVAKLGDLSSFPPPSDEAIQEAFAWAFDGIAIDLVRPVEAELEELDEAAAEAAEADEPAPISSDTPLPEGDDDIPFGEEEADAEPEA